MEKIEYPVKFASLVKGHVPPPGLSTVVPPKLPAAPTDVPPPASSTLDPEVAKRLEDKKAEFQRKAAELLQKAKGSDN